MEDSEINFVGLIHDHGIDKQKPDEQELCPTIAILKRLPMYDSLIMVKKYRNCLGKHALEFPLGKYEDFKQNQEEIENIEQDTSDHKTKCNRMKLVSGYLDGDNPLIFNTPSSSTSEIIAADAANELIDEQSETITSAINRISIDSNFGPKFPIQIDDLGQECELIQVAMNGLLDRLKVYSESGVVVDAKVYAFAMGLKTAERLLTRDSMKEINETPAI